MYTHALRCLAAVARHGSYTGAAEELFITPAAVGQQIRQLEEYLQVALFMRLKTGKQRLLPTAAATAVLGDIEQGFDLLDGVLQRLRHGQDQPRVVLACSPAFANKWLLPRFAQLTEALPHIDVQLNTSIGLQDYQQHGIDLGVRYGKGDWQGVLCQSLMQEKVTAVASPALVKGDELSVADIQRLPLIHDASVGRDKGFFGWQQWLQEQGIQRAETESGLVINDSAAVIQAALAGQGIALGRSALIERELNDRELLAFEAGWQCQKLGYYLAINPASQLRANVVEVRNWLLSLQYEVPDC